MIRKQARDLCGRDIGRTASVPYVGGPAVGPIRSIQHGHEYVDILMENADGERLSSEHAINVGPTETVEVSGSDYQEASQA